VATVPSYGAPTQLQQEQPRQHTQDSQMLANLGEVELPVSDGASEVPGAIWKRVWVSQCLGVSWGRAAVVQAVTIQGCTGGWNILVAGLFGKSSSLCRRRHR
jgi:hypothetical protein